MDPVQTAPDLDQDCLSKRLLMIKLVMVYNGVHFRFPSWYSNGNHLLLEK